MDGKLQPGDQAAAEGTRYDDKRPCGANQIRGRPHALRAVSDRNLQMAPLAAPPGSQGRPERKERDDGADRAHSRSSFSGPPGPLRLGGAERLPAIINGTGAIALGLGPGLHWPNIPLGVFLGTAVHAVLRWAAGATRRCSKCISATSATRFATAHFPIPMLLPRLCAGRSNHIGGTDAVARGKWGLAELLSHGW